MASELLLQLKIISLFANTNFAWSGSIDDRFNYYEKLSVGAVTHHVEKRAAGRASVHERVISIDALGK